MCDITLIQLARHDLDDRRHSIEERNGLGDGWREKMVWELVSCWGELYSWFMYPHKPACHVAE